MNKTNIPSFRECYLNITSNKFSGNIDQRAWRDNQLTKKLIQIMNFEPDGIIVSNVDLQAIRDFDYQKELLA